MYTCMICYPNALYNTNLQQFFFLLSKVNTGNTKSALLLPISLFSYSFLTIPITMQTPLLYEIFE